jgi:hypothetical protein
MAGLIQAANREMAANFAKRWTHKGVAIFMDDTHHQFAADFANIVITSFVEQQQRRAMIEAEKKKVVVTDSEGA